MPQQIDDNAHGSPVHRRSDPDYVSAMKEHPDWQRRRSGEAVDAWLDRLARGFR